MLCPHTSGTASVINQSYDSYQWYSKYWFTSEEFEPIPGATDASFTYDWYTYDQSLLKVVVTLGTDTLESNVIQIDSYAWTTLIIIHEMNEFVRLDPDSNHLILCEGESFNNTIGSPYNTNIQWYKDYAPIPGANETSYLITEPGTYYVEGAPDFCPNVISSNIATPFVVEIDTNCVLSINNPNSLQDAIQIYPNPVSHSLQLNIGAAVAINKYSIMDITGKTLVAKRTNFTDTAIIDVNSLSNGLYILVLESEIGNSIHKFIKE
ncbi:T9SS type A sorting domain-containing protein [Aequorivita viscosa]|nr:T9SS type A sorting domain-containing protein [Aequorivita viscosa]